MSAADTYAIIALVLLVVISCIIDELNRRL